MKIVVVVPRADNLSSAGVRIRYLRLQKHLAALDHQLSIEIVQDLNLKKKLAGDVYLICKCYDVRSSILAETARDQGKLVGIDIFDDYFSQSDDSNFVHMRRWLNTLGARSNFVLSATRAMADRLETILPDLPCHTLNDPAKIDGCQQLEESVTQRLRHTRESGVVDILWFGMGDNPHFPVGLDDLAAFGPELTRFRAAGLSPRLQVLTNKRAMTTERIARLARLPIPVTLGEWSEEAEAKALAKCFIAFLPVNGQPFSTVKSLNRCVSAVTSGAQVLSAGFPLYKQLDDLIYRRVDDVIRDIRSGRPRIRAATLPGLEHRLKQLGSAELEAQRLVDFLDGLKRPKPKKSDGRPVFVVHGVASTGDIHKFAQRARCFSVASSFQTLALNFDLRFERRADDGVDAICSERLGKTLSKNMQARLTDVAGDGPIRFQRLPLEGAHLSGAKAASMVEMASDYASSISETGSLISLIEPKARILVAELQSPYQFESDDNA